MTVLNIKGKQNFKEFNYIHIVEIPSQKGEHSWKCTELSLKRKEEILELDFMIQKQLKST